MFNFSVGVVGLGYVGLPLALRCLEVGHRVHAFDLDATKGDNAEQFLRANLQQPESLNGRFDFATSPKILEEADVIVICVPTPLTNGSPEFCYLREASESVARHASQGALVILESTTSPGTTENLVTGAFDGQGRFLDHDYFLGYSPERINPGSKSHAFEAVPKVVSGMSNESLSKAVEFYSTVFDQVVTASSPKVAEATKLFENSFRLVNIALVNEFARACDSMGISASEALDLAETKPFGFMRFDPGLGAGGHCIPVDPSYLTYYLDDLQGHQMQLVVQATASNLDQPEFVANWISKRLEKLDIPVSGLKFGLIGVSYKADVSDLRESMSVALSSILMKNGHSVVEYDEFSSEERDIRPLEEMSAQRGIEAWLVAQPLAGLITPSKLKVLELEISRGVPVFDLTGQLPINGCIRL